MNPITTTSNQLTQCRKPCPCTITDFQRRAGKEATVLDRKNDRRKQRLIGRIKGAVDKDTAVVSNRGVVAAAILRRLPFALGDGTLNRVANPSFA